MLLIPAWWLLGALVGLAAAQQRGFSLVSGLLSGLFLGPLAFLMFWATGSPRCGACREFVQAGARLCKHCRTPIVWPTGPPVQIEISDAAMVGLQQAHRQRQDAAFARARQQQQPH